jgi:hypothetical protein
VAEFNTASPIVLPDGTMSYQFRDYLFRLGTATNALVPGSDISLLTNDAGYITGIPLESITFAAVNKALEPGEYCTVISAGLTLTLPVAPLIGSVVRVGVLAFTNTVIDPGSDLLMGLAETMTIDVPNFAWRFCYLGVARGWRIG